MKRANLGFYYSLLAALCVVPNVSDAGIRVGSASRNNAQAYQQINSAYQAAAATPNGVVSTTPVVTAPAEQIGSDPKMERCAMIYPTGEFAWAKPTIGRMRGASPMCTSVVRMVAVGAGANGGDAVIATANLAAGDTIRCNIDEFPAYTHSTEDISVSVPADHEPTMEEVIQVMNQEQKQNAGWKILGATLTFALAGNLAGDSAPGDESVMGFGKDKMVATGIAAAGGAALSAASVYSGKVAGDMIMSAGLNATAGSVMGNVAASAGGGKDTLRIEKCEGASDNDQFDCLWGWYEVTQTLDDKVTAYVNAKNINDFMVCKSDNGTEDCSKKKLANADVDWGITDEEKQKNPTLTLREKQKEDWDQVADENKFCYGYSKDSGPVRKLKMKELNESACPDNEDLYIKLTKGFLEVTRSTNAVVRIPSITQFNASDLRDWSAFKSKLKSSDIYKRSGGGKVGTLIAKADIENFRPMYLEASDGGIVDMDNKSRLGGTLAGAGVGGAMGAYSAYQGAQTEIEERWVAAVREYKDSLQNVVCMTGQRFLAQYNDPVTIPAMTE